MSGRWSRAVAGAALMLALPALSACNGGGDPESQGTPTPKFSEAPSESASASELASGPAPGPVTPKQIAKAYLRELSRGINEGEVDGFLSYTNGACINCQSVADGIEQRYGSGGSMKNSSGWQLVSFRKLGAAPDGPGIVYTSTVDIGSQQSLDASGSIVQQSQASTETFIFLFRRVDGELKIAGWDVK